MLVPAILIILGFVLLIKGANWLVNGTSALAKKYNVSDLAIGLTIVAFGTSAPELVVNSVSSIESHSHIVFGVHVNSIYLILPTEWPNMPQLPDILSVRIFSAIVFTIGVVILFVAWFGLGTKPSLGMDKNKLKTGGLYHYSRNPQLLGYGIILIAFVILFFSTLSLLWFLLYIIISYFMVKSEEEFLEQKYGQEYKAYCNSVPRIF